MRKLFIFLCLNYLLFGDVLSDAIKTAQVFYDKQEYQKTIDTLEPLVYDYIDNQQLNFIMGQAYAGIGDYETSVMYFERILINHEDDLRTRAELASVYMKLGMDADALQSFNYVLKHNIPTNVRKNITKQVEFLKSKKKKDFFQIFVTIGLTYDTNINNVTDTTTFDTLNYTDLSVTDKQYSDISLLNLVGLNYLHKFDKQYSLLNRFSVTKQLFDKDSQRLNDTTATLGDIEAEQKKELDLLSYSAIFINENGNKKISYGIDFVNTRLASDDYLNMYGFNIDYTRKYLQDIYSSLNIKYFKKSYVEDINKNLNSDNIQLTLGDIVPTDNYGKYNLVYQFLGEIMEQSDDPNVQDKYTNSVIISNQYNITKKFVLNTSGTFSYISYQDDDPTFGIKREDNFDLFSLGIQYNVSDTFNISSNIKYINNSSNISIYSYDKATFDIYINKVF